MKIESEADLARICDLLRAKGVKSFEVDGIKVDFAALEEPAAAQKATEDPEQCNCKCPVYAHTNGLCVNGCDPEKCAPQAGATA